MSSKNIKADYGDDMEYATDISKKPEKPGGKDIKNMSNNTKTEAVKASRNRYQKSRGEHAKDILIAILITAVIAFVLGMQFANKQSAEVRNAVSAAQEAAAPKAEAIAAPASK